MTGLDLTSGVRVVPEARLVTSRHPDSSDGWLMRLRPAPGGASVREHLEPADSFLLSRRGNTLVEYFEYDPESLDDGVYATDIRLQAAVTAETFIRIAGGIVRAVTTDPREAARWLAREHTIPPTVEPAPVGMAALAARFARQELSR